MVLDVKKINLKAILRWKKNVEKIVNDSSVFVLEWLIAGHYCNLWASDKLYLMSGN